MLFLSIRSLIPTVMRLIFQSKRREECAKHFSSMNEGPMDEGLRRMLSEW
jgi:hypothetical protein